jgi:hypothetical protein
MYIVERWVLSARQVICSTFARCDAVDKTLQCLVKWGNLRRVDRGLYDKPQFNSLTQQDSPADPKAVTRPLNG